MYDRIIWGPAFLNRNQIFDWNSSRNVFFAKIKIQFRCNLFHKYGIFRVSNFAKHKTPWNKRFWPQNVHFISFVKFAKQFWRDKFHIYGIYGIKHVSNFTKIQKLEYSAFRRASNLSNLQTYPSIIVNVWFRRDIALGNALAINLLLLQYHLPMASNGAQQHLSTFRVWFQSNFSSVSIVCARSFHFFISSHLVHRKWQCILSPCSSNAKAVIQGYLYRQFRLLNRTTI